MGESLLGSLDVYFQDLRYMNRFPSTFAFHVLLFLREGAFEVNPIDLIGLKVLRVFGPDVHRELTRAKEILTGNHGLGGRSQEDKAAADCSGSSRKLQICVVMRLARY